MPRSVASLLITVIVASVVVAAPSAADDQGAFPVSGAATDVLIQLDDLGLADDADRVADVLDRVLGGSVRTTAVVAELDVVAATVTPEGLAVLESLAVVHEVEPVRELELLLDLSVSTIDADDLHGGGLTGAGKAVVVIDTGVDGDLPGIDLVAEACFVPSAPDDCAVGTGPGAAEPCSDPAIACGHGSHIASIITADGGDFTGVAPDAGIIGIRVADDEAGISELGVLQALLHVLALAETHDIAAVNLSLGGDGSDCSSPLWEDLIDQLTAAGIAVVGASGNLLPGENWENVPVDFPACLPGVTAVGSTTEGGSISEFTQSGAELDLLAPGECVDSDRFDDPPGPCPNTSGTSFAAPHVAAAFALVDGVLPGFGPERTSQLLRTTGEFVTRATQSPLDRDPRWAEVRLSRVVDFVPFADTAVESFWTAASDWGRFSGVTAGIDGLNFGAYGTLTRAQAVTLLWRFMGSPTGFPPAGFVDVGVGDFYALAVDWAKATGVTAGVSPTAFGPAAAVTRAQVAAFLWRMVGSPVVAPPTRFVDVFGSDYYALAVDWMTARSITTGTSPTTYSPQWVIDRGQIITFLHRLARAAEAWPGPVLPPAIVLF